MADNKKEPVRPCKKCKTEVSIKTQVCPQCGTKNPALRWHDWLILAVAAVAVLWLPSQCVFSPDKNDPVEAPRAESVESRTPVPEPSKTVVQKATFEELQAAYNLAQERADFIRKLHDIVEPLVAAPNQTIVTQDILDAKKLASDLSYTLTTEQPPKTDEDLTVAFREMNHELGMAAAMIEKRINHAIELSSGAKNPVKATEQFAYTARAFERRMSAYEESARQVDNWLNTQRP